MINGFWVPGSDYYGYRPHETLSFSLVPADFFAENPSIDVPSERNLSAKEVIYQGGVGSSTGGGVANGMNGAVNGGANGVANGVTNGHANGHANGYVNGHANGDTNGTCCGGH